MEKISEVRQNIEKGEKFMDLYKIPFSEVIITLGMHHIEKLGILQLIFMFVDLNYLKIYKIDLKE